MNHKQLTLLTLAVATALSACSQPKDEALSTPDSQKVEAPGMNIESEEDASTVITSDEIEVTITGNKSVQKRACNGQDVQIQGDENQANFTGRCAGLYVIGNQNRITLENVTTIQVTGDDNTVRWRGTEPEITNIGKGNTIAKAE